jgi:anti-sigma28 factor (negative regulator of flagellin synthesis)
MKIEDQSNVGGISSPGAKGVESTAGREAARGAERAGSDRAELSGRAGKISEALNQDATARAATVERLRLEVAAGRYHPDAAAVSHAVVNEALASGAAAGGTETK